MAEIHPPLIPDLPDEIAMECLLRIPHRFHSDLKLVCHGWQSLFSRPEFYSERRRLGAAEHLICLVQPLPPATEKSTDMDVDGEDENEDSPAPEKTQPDRRIYGPPEYTLGVYNVTRREWRRLAMSPAGISGGIRIPMFCQAVALPATGRLLLLGGWDPDTLESVRDVYVIDLVGGGWRRGAPMAAARSFFAVAVVVEGGGERVYVAGGHDGGKNALRAAEVYDVAEDEWAALPPMAEERDECLGMAAGGGFMVVSGYATESQGRFRSDAERYDPETGRWSRVDGVWPSATAGPRVTAVGGDYGGGLRRWWWLVGQQEESGEVREFDWAVMRWTAPRTVSMPNGLSGGSSLCVVDMGGAGGGRGFFVMGNGDAGGDGVFVVEGEGGPWKNVQTPPGFFGFPFSASHLLV